MTHVQLFVSEYTRAAPMPANSEQCYGFNQFAVQLNGFEKDMREKLPPTDSRFRPDQRSPFLSFLYIYSTADVLYVCMYVCTSALI